MFDHFHSNKLDKRAQKERTRCDGKLVQIFHNCFLNFDSATRNRLIRRLTVTCARLREKREWSSRDWEGHVIVICERGDCRVQSDHFKMVRLAFDTNACLTPWKRSEGHVLQPVRFEILACSNWYCCHSNVFCALASIQFYRTSGCTQNSIRMPIAHLFLLLFRFSFKRHKRTREFWTFSSSVMSTPVGISVEIFSSPSSPSPSYQAGFVTSQHHSATRPPISRSASFASALLFAIILFPLFSLLLLLLLRSASAFDLPFTSAQPPIHFRF
jgi:hypothetical protein